MPKDEPSATPSINGKVSGSVGRLYTRKEAAKHLQDVHGIPCRPSRLAKDAMSIDGAAPLLPAPVARFGRTNLYTLDQIDAYAERLVKIEPPNDQPR